jgi:hypothetical protein
MTKEGDIEEAASMEVPMEEFDAMMGSQEKETMVTKDVEEVKIEKNDFHVARFSTMEEDMNRRMMYASACLCAVGVVIVGSVVGSILPT